LTTSLLTPEAPAAISYTQTPGQRAGRFFCPHCRFGTTVHTKVHTISTPDNIFINQTLADSTQRFSPNLNNTS
jgi:hypothetical protein